MHNDNTKYIHFRDTLFKQNNDNKHNEVKLFVNNLLMPKSEILKVKNLTIDNIFSYFDISSFIVKEHLQFLGIDVDV